MKRRSAPPYGLVRLEKGLYILNCFICEVVWDLGKVMQFWKSASVVLEYTEYQIFKIYGSMGDVNVYRGGPRLLQI